MTRWFTPFAPFAPFLLAAAALLGFSSAAQAIEEPGFEVVKRYAEFELRRYPPYLVAEVWVPGPAEVAGNTAFEYLGGYIFGKNKGSRQIAMTAPVTQAPAPVKIEMTAPVAQTAADGGYVVQFAMPREFTMDTLPEPTNPKVKLREMPARQMAVLRYSGTWSMRLYEEKLAALRAAVAAAGLKTEGEPVFARFNSPISLPPFRRNEIWLNIAP
jgi:hypothetical protein